VSESLPARGDVIVYLISYGTMPYIGTTIDTIVQYLLTPYLGLIFPGIISACALPHSLAYIMKLSLS
jgi:hypothetical protein